MSEHVTPVELQRFRRGELPPSEVLAVARHLGVCTACAALARAGSGAAGYESLRLALAGTPEHVTAEALSDYVDGVAGADVAEHVRLCARCRAEAEDLAGFRARRQSRGWIGLALAAAASIVIVLLLNQFFRQAPPPHGKPPVRGTPLQTPVARLDPWSSLVAEAVAARRIQPPEFLHELRGTPDELRGRSSAPSEARLAPAGVVVVSDRPHFTWTATAKHALVSVFDGEKRVARSGLLDVSEWIPPQPLPRGRTYQWQVELRGDLHGGGSHIIPAPPDPPAAFRIVDDTSFRDLTEAQRDRPGDHLLLGILYARAGAQEEAAKELVTYRNTHPNDAAAQELMESVQAW